jgi:hypothetical protein
MRRFEKVLQPAVENCRLKLVLITQVGYGTMIDQVAIEDGNLLFRGVIVTFFSHGASFRS